MPKSKTRKNVDENFKVAAVQRLQTGGVPANDLAKELGVSIGHCAGGREPGSAEVDMIGGDL